MEYQIVKNVINTNQIIAEAKGVTILSDFVIQTERKKKQ